MVAWVAMATPIFQIFIYIYAIIILNFFFTVTDKILNHNNDGTMIVLMVHVKNLIIWVKKETEIDF